MPILDIDERLPSIGPEFFKPSDYQGKSIKVAILTMKKLIGTEIHWAENAEGKKFPYECIRGDCCIAFEAPQQAYIIPIWLYDDPNGKPGKVQAFSISPWKLENSFMVLRNNGIDLEKRDLVITCTKKGQGTDYTLTALDSSNLNQVDRDLIAKEILPNFFKFAESAARRDMTAEKYNELITSVGKGDMVFEARAAREAVNDTPLSLSAPSRKSTPAVQATAPLAKPTHKNEPRVAQAQVVDSAETTMDTSGDESFSASELNALLGKSKK